MDYIQLFASLSLVVMLGHEIYKDYVNQIVKIKYFDKTLSELECYGDWIDLYNKEEVSLKVSEHKLIDLNVAIKLPKGYEAHILPRSSTFKNYGLLIANSMGVVDNAYCGDNDEWKLSAIATKEITIPKGSRIAQFRIIPSQNVKLKTVDSLNGSDRGGFGSSGK